MTIPRAIAAASRARRAGERAGCAAPARGGHPAVLVTGEETGGRFALVALVLARGAEPPCHRLHWEDETLYVLFGALRVRVGDAQVEAPAAAAVFPTRGVEHGLVVATREAPVLAHASPTPAAHPVARPEHSRLHRLTRRWRLLNNGRVDALAVRVALIRYPVAALGRPRRLGLAVDRRPRPLPGAAVPRRAATAPGRCRSSPISATLSRPTRGSIPASSRLARLWYASDHARENDRRPTARQGAW